MAALYLGLISGTSADGIDVALASFARKPKLLAGLTHPYPEDLRRRILALAQGDGRIALDEFGALDVEIARAFAAAALTLLKREKIDATRIRALGSHGQTVRHRPLGAAPYTMQLGDPNVIAESTGIATVADFRRRDIAAGGHGAPLAPAFHAAMLAHDGKTRVVLNLGGIANITILAGDKKKPLRGFDTGPASCLLDAWIARHRDQPFDKDGAFAASGRIDDTLLKRLLSEPYFAESPPKSTGREVFHLAWLAEHLRGLAIAPKNVQATLVALSALTIADAIHAHARDAREVWVCGGGVHNPVLMAAIAQALAPIPVASIARLGIDPDFVEAMTFAWLARERLENRAAPNVYSVTGARGPRVLGGVYYGGG
ncbi:MAG: anhydro-N-acetylmuramic acid kinase [Rudaea sp.]|uniref:anhydro-N-acetylmuramic acid kinase n=1 Tax=Rudaea sp. TaxID=2136325 RepID=UPI0039E3A737